MEKARAAFFVDGFNLYHSLRTTTRTEKCRWLDITGLCRGLLKKSESLVQVTYFTSLATWDQGKVTRHKRLIGALRGPDFRVIYGRGVSA